MRKTEQQKFGRGIDLSSFVIDAPIVRDEMIREAEVAGFLGAKPWHGVITIAPMRKTIRFTFRGGADL